MTTDSAPTCPALNRESERISAQPDVLLIMPDQMRGDCLSVLGMLCTDKNNAIVSRDYKYLKCFKGARAGQLYDLKNDPCETRNSANDPEAGEPLAAHRRLFAQLYTPTSNDQ